MVFYAGEIQNSFCRRLETATFFSYKWVRFARRADKGVALQLVVVVSHNQRIGCQPEILLYTVADPARGLLNREKKKKEKVSLPVKHRHQQRMYVEFLPLSLSVD